MLWKILSLLFRKTASFLGRLIWTTVRLTVRLAIYLGKIFFLLAVALSLQWAQPHR